MQAFLEENYEQASTNVVNEIIEYLKQTKNSFEEYFPADREVLMKDHAWVLNPFSVCAKPSSLSSSDYKSLIDLISDLTLESFFNSNSYAEFWLSLKDKNYEGLMKQKHYYYLLLLLTYASQDFRYTLQLKPNIAIASTLNLISDCNYQNKT